MSTRYWGGSITLTDAQAAELFASRLPLVEIPADVSQRVTARVLAEVRRVRAFKGGPSGGSKGTKCNRCGGPAMPLPFGLTACGKCGVA